MSSEEIESLVAEFRKATGSDISDIEVMVVMNLCIRKIELTGQTEDYLKLLLPDELKNYVFRRAVNAKTMLRPMKKEEMECAVFV